MKFSHSFILSMVLVSASAGPVFADMVMTREMPSGVVLNVRPVGPSRAERLGLISRFPKYLAEAEAPSREWIEEWRVSDAEGAKFLATMPRLTARGFLGAATEVRTIAQQGPNSNRINLTILGDGYTLAEKEKFFQDAERMTRDLFTGSTFASYVSLFNVYAVFVESQESGISDRVKKRTAFGLYRSPAGSKRGIMPGNSSALEAALKLAPANADYPIVIANDDYYGGLGGRYAITTRSIESGPMVLRHELGHNFGNVGEEYDGGQVYSGANFSKSAQVTWSHWLDQPLQVFNAQQLSGDYVWKNLSQGSYRARFQFPNADKVGAYQFVARISAVGWKTPDEILVRVDGVKLDLHGVYTDDRSFFDLVVPMSLAPGTHEIEVSENVHDGDNVLAFAVLHAMPMNYDYTPNRIAAFLNFNDSATAVGYRPTDDSCLMRNMRSNHFCSVDLENMWIRFLNKVNLIDSVKSERKTNGKVGVSLATVPVRGLSIQWQKQIQGKWTPVTEWNGLNSLETEPGTQLQVQVDFRTSEVRKPSSRFKSVQTITAN